MLHIYGLSYRYSEGHYYRHVVVNDIIHKVLTSVHIPYKLEPSDVYHSDGKCPNSITTVLWKNRKLLMWDGTCPDTYTLSYVDYGSRKSSYHWRVEEEEILSS